jgi:hypothetical protein
MNAKIKAILTFVIIANSVIVFCQKIEVFGGINSNIFYDHNENNPHYNSSYKSDFGYCAGIGFESKKKDWLTVRFTLQLDNYGGEINAYTGELGGGNLTEATIDKWLISLGLFPVNFRLCHKIDLNFGLEVSRLIKETYIGTLSGWLYKQPNWSYDLHDIYDHFSSPIYIGLRGRISYEFKLSKSYVITPQYSFYFGLSKEFQEFPHETKSMRHYLNVGIKKKIK